MIIDASRSFVKKPFSVGVQSPTEINAPRGCAVILRRICQLSLTRITHQVSCAFDLNLLQNKHSRASSGESPKRWVRGDAYVSGRSIVWRRRRETCDTDGRIIFVGVASIARLRECV